MIALRKIAKGWGNVRLVEMEDPRPGTGEVLIRVAAAGICGTDIHIFHDVFPKVRIPVTLGHELAGEVAEVGGGVDTWRPGDRVTVESAASFCGKCTHCLQGQTQRCEERVALGYGKDGGFASYVAVRSTALHRIPDTISLEEGALCEPLACAVHAVMERSSLTQGSWAIVTGPGPIGLLVLQVAKAVGAQVAVVGAAGDEGRLELASRLGAVECLKAETVGRKGVLGKGVLPKAFDVAFECSGTRGGVLTCMEFLKRGGQIVQVGILGKEAPLDLDLVTYGEIELRGCFAHNRASWEKAVKLLEDGKVNLRPLISGIYELGQWEEAFARFERREGLKFLLKPP